MGRMGQYIGIANIFIFMHEWDIYWTRVVVYFHYKVTARTIVSRKNIYNIYLSRHSVNSIIGASMNTGNYVVILMRDWNTLWILTAYWLQTLKLFWGMYQYVTCCQWTASRIIFHRKNDLIFLSFNMWFPLKRLQLCLKHFMAWQFMQ